MTAIAKLLTGVTASSDTNKNKPCHNRDAHECFPRVERIVYKTGRWCMNMFWESDVGTRVFAIYIVSILLLVQNLSQNLHRAGGLPVICVIVPNA